MIVDLPFSSESSLPTGRVMSFELEERRRTSGGVNQGLIALDPVPRLPRRDVPERDQLTGTAVAA